MAANVTGKESRQYDAEELATLVKETAERGLPAWITAGLQAQLDQKKILSLTAEMAREANAGRFAE